MKKLKVLDHGVPLTYFQSERRQIVEKWRLDNETPPTNADIERLATLQLVIAACKDVIAEMDSEGL